MVETTRMENSVQNALDPYTLFVVICINNFNYKLTNNTMRCAIIPNQKHQRHWQHQQHWHP